MKVGDAVRVISKRIRYNTTRNLSGDRGIVVGHHSMGNIVTVQLETYGFTLGFAKMDLTVIEDEREAALVHAAIALGVSDEGG